jgi:hypothetical protein
MTELTLDDLIGFVGDDARPGDQEKPTVYVLCDTYRRLKNDPKAHEIDGFYVGTLVTGASIQMAVLPVAGPIRDWSPGDPMPWRESEPLDAEKIAHDVAVAAKLPLECVTGERPEPTSGTLADVEAALNIAIANNVDKSLATIQKAVYANVKDRLVVGAPLCVSYEPCLRATHVKIQATIGPDKVWREFPMRGRHRFEILPEPYSGEEPRFKIYTVKDFSPNGNDLVIGWPEEVKIDCSFTRPGPETEYEYHTSVEWTDPETGDAVIKFPPRGDGWERCERRRGSDYRAISTYREMVAFFNREHIGKSGFPRYHHYRCPLPAPTPLIYDHCPSLGPKPLPWPERRPAGAVKVR